ncbi:hypothetical protein pb186bvf_012491 [Paramecium bursaria]
MKSKLQKPRFSYFESTQAERYSKFIFTRKLIALNSLQLILAILFNWIGVLYIDEKKLVESKKLKFFVYGSFITIIIVTPYFKNFLQNIILSILLYLFSIVQISILTTFAIRHFGLAPIGIFLVNILFIYLSFLGATFIEKKRFSYAKTINIIMIFSSLYSAILFINFDSTFDIIITSYFVSLTYGLMLLFIIIHEDQYLLYESAILSSILSYSSIFKLVFIFIEAISGEYS